MLISFGYQLLWINLKIILLGFKSTVSMFYFFTLSFFLEPSNGSASLSNFRCKLHGAFQTPHHVIPTYVIWDSCKRYILNIPCLHECAWHAEASGRHWGLWILCLIPLRDCLLNLKHNVLNSLADQRNPGIYSSLHLQCWS